MESGGTRLGLAGGGKEEEAASEELAAFSCSPACVGGLGSMKRRFGPTNCVMTQSSSSSSGDWRVLLAEDAEVPPTNSFAPATNSTGSTSGSGSGSGDRSPNAPSLDTERARLRDVSLASTRRGTSSTRDELDKSPCAGGCETSVHMCITKDKVGLI